MPFNPTPLGGQDVDRFGNKKTRDVVWLAEIADPDLVPTASEINTGTSLTCAVQELSGFAISPRYAELPDICSDVDAKVWDGSSLDDSSITFYLARDQDDALSFFNEGDQGYVIDCPYGLVDAATAFVYRAEVSSVSPVVATAGGAMGTVAFAITGRRKVTLPTES